MSIDVNYETARDAWISDSMDELEIEREVAPDAAKEGEGNMADLNYRNIAEWAFGSAFEQDETYDYGRDIPETVKERMLTEIEAVAAKLDNEEDACHFAADAAVALRDEYAGTPQF